VSLSSLLPLFEREHCAERAFALGVLVHTSGSTYQKPGALILMSALGDYAGLISGGCLEGDLRERALRVLQDGEPQLVCYDSHGPEDLLWGLGLGCEGEMRILVLRVGPDNDWQPLKYLVAALETGQPAAVGLVCESSRTDVALGALVLPGSDAARSAALASSRLQRTLAAAAHAAQCTWYRSETRDLAVFLLPLQRPSRLLVLGAGPDAAPVVEFASRLDWKVTVLDHRAAYADPKYFKTAEKVIGVDPAELNTAVDLRRFQAAVVMSHHLATDLAYLRALAHSEVPYVGLLGPPRRRDRLLADLGLDASRLNRRLRAPVGLPLGGRTPEAIALAIVAELQAFVHEHAQPASVAHLSRRIG
jgi:xanthine dehydrogenase accessory factor